MKIYTGKGDGGKTRGADGAVLSKNDPVIWLEGDADELCACLGQVRAMMRERGVNDQAQQFIEAIQRRIHKLMAHVSDSANSDYMITGGDVAELEREIDRLSSDIEKGFRLPGRNVIDAQIHVARTVTRRVERRFFAAAQERSLCASAGVYLNRLSDYLFALSQTQ